MALRFKPCGQRRSTTCSPSRPSTSSTGAGLLAEMLGEAADREDIAERMREAEHDGRRDHPRDRPAGEHARFVTPFDREDIYALASGLDDVMDFMEEAVDLILLYEVDELPAGAGRPGRGASSAAPS